MRRCKARSEAILAAVLALVVFTIGCQGSDPDARPAPPPATGEGASPLGQRYTNDEAGLVLDYPDGWTAQEGADQPAGPGGPVRGLSPGRRSHHQFLPAHMSTCLAQRDGPKA